MTSAEIRDAYDESADAWAAGPEPVYARLAVALVTAAPVPVRGARVLDLGAGTGVASRAAVAAGAARVVGVDIAEGMLRRSASACAPVLGDAAALPFGAATFDLVLAACCLGHLPDPVRVLRETRRVATAVVASAFPANWTHPAKTAVEDALVPLGFRPPDWYVTFKRDREARVGAPDALAALARAAAYPHVAVHVAEVATGLDTPAALASWRFGMAHVAPFVRTLDPARQSALRRAAEDALVGAPPLVVPLIVLVAS